MLLLDTFQDLSFTKIQIIDYPQYHNGSALDFNSFKENPSNTFHADGMLVM